RGAAHARSDGAGAARHHRQHSQCGPLGLALGNASGGWPMKNSLVIGLLVVVLLGLLGSVYVVREDQTAMVLNLGKVVRADLKPGLHFEWPLVETVREFDLRFQVLDTAPARYCTA